MIRDINNSTQKEEEKWDLIQNWEFMSELVLVGFEPVDEYDYESSCDEPEA